MAYVDDEIVLSVFFFFFTKYYFFCLEITNRDVFNKSSNNANWIKNEPVEMVDGNMDLALGLGELAQLTVNNESESNIDVSHNSKCNHNSILLLCFKY